jgi:hypothetical protein
MYKEIRKNSNFYFFSLDKTLYERFSKRGGLIEQNLLIKMTVLLFLQIGFVLCFVSFKVTEFLD